MNLIQELKRRKVFKTLGVYAAAALIIIQVADIVFPRLLLPDWTVTLIVVLVIIGFPITFFLSWNYDITPDKHKQSEGGSEDLPTAKESVPGEKTNINVYTITGAVLACVGISFWFFFSTSSFTTAEENLIENSIAVFSFENLSPIDNNSRMGEILQHLIISDLSGLTHLNVISHQRLQDIQKQNSGDIENYTIAQQANAKVLLSGSIMDLSGKKILVGELIDAIDGNVITSHRIEGKDIYSMVDELTDNIHKDLDISKHSNDDIELQAGTKTTKSIDAYEQFLEGFNYLSELDFESANIKFQDAVKIDSTFFDAHYLSAIAMWWMDESETNVWASNYCKKLIDNKIYNDDLQKLKAEGAYNLIRGNYKDALPIYEKIIDLNPNDKTSWYMYGEANYHIEKGEEEEKYWAVADEAFKKALDLDPHFGVAKSHIINMLMFSQDYSQIIKESTESLKRNAKDWNAYHAIILSYELLEDSINAEKYIAKARSNLGPGKRCNMNLLTGWNLALTRQKINFNNQTKYHLRRAVYYLQNAVANCSDDKIHPPSNNNFTNAPHMDPLPIIIAYRAYNEKYAENLYNKISSDLSDNDKMQLASRIGQYNLWNNLRRQFPDESEKYKSEFSYFYLMKALELSKKINDQQWFLRSLKYLLVIYPNINSLQTEENFLYTELNSFCGSKFTIECLDFEGNSNKVLYELADDFYNLGIYNEAEKIFQSVLDKVNLSIDFDEPKSDILKSMIHNIYYKLGLINLKMHNYFLARQNFISGSTSLKENKALIDKYVSYNWATNAVFKSRIAECYYKENNFANAIKYYREVFNLEDSFNEKVKSLSMRALCEYYNNEIDSTKLHFQKIENYIKNDEIEYDGEDIQYYIDWPLYLYYYAKGNVEKADKYLTSAYYHITKDKRDKYLSDNERTKNLHKYYYIHEIIETYNQNIR